ncbi:MAG: ComEC/Rec2 family competence protein [bacterium]|nr:ComEC/Rec2 family competence protein [bacterium]
MHKSHVFFYFLIAFVAGVFAGSYLDVSYELALWLMLPASIAVLIFWRRSWVVVLSGLCLIFFVGGVLRFNTVYSKDSILTKFSEDVPLVQGKPINIKVFLRGYIDGEVSIKENRQIFTFRVKQIETDGQLTDSNERVLITADIYPVYNFGQALEIFGSPPQVPENFDGFDYKSYLKKDRIFTVMRYPKIEIVEKGVARFDLSGHQSLWEKFITPVFGQIFKFKKSFEDSIARSVSEPNASYISGILLGSRSQIPEDLKNDFAITGTTHILAISGYNITIVGAIVAGFFMLFMRRQKAFWLTVLGIIVFTILTGAQASVVRASIMGVLILLAQSAGRFYSIRNSIAFAGALMVFANPLVLRFDVGFQLSFMATLGLIYLAPLIEPYFKKIPAKYALRETAVMTISAQLMVLPLLIFYFKNISLVSLPANILILPMVPFNMLLGFITGLAGIATPFLGVFIGNFAWALSSVVLGIIKLFARVPFASIPASLNWAGVTVGYALILWWMIKLKKQKAPLAD